MWRKRGENPAIFLHSDIEIYPELIIYQRIRLRSTNISGTNDMPPAGGICCCCERTLRSTVMAARIWEQEALSRSCINPFTRALSYQKFETASLIMITINISPDPEHTRSPISPSSCARHPHPIYLQPFTTIRLPQPHCPKSSQHKQAV